MAGRVECGGGSDWPVGHSLGTPALEDGSNEKSKFYTSRCVTANLTLTLTLVIGLAFFCEGCPWLLHALRALLCFSSCVSSPLPCPFTVL